MASPPSAGDERDAVTFGGLVPSCAVVRHEETLVAILGIEHFRDGAAVHTMVLTEAPGLIDWAARSGLALSDDVGTTYSVAVLAQTQGLGQVSTTLWISPAIPAEATRLHFVISELLRVSPPRGGEPTMTRPLSGGPWEVDVDLAPDRTVAEAPPPSERRQRIPEAGTVPARTITAFIDTVPIGQAKLSEGIAVCVISAERYWDRWVLTLAALGQPDQGNLAPAIGRARVSAWDDCGNRYRATPIQGTARENWSEVSIEMLPSLDPQARRLAVRVEDIPRGNDVGPLPIQGPLVFGIRVPAA